MGNSRTWDLFGGHFGVLSPGAFLAHSSLNKRKEDAKMWDLFYFLFFNSMLIMFTIFSGKVQSSAGCFSQLYSFPFGSNFSEFLIFSNVFAVVDDFLES
jgi:hypothetical protein